MSEYRAHFSAKHGAVFYPSKDEFMANLERAAAPRCPTCGGTKEEPGSIDDAGGLGWSCTNVFHDTTGER